jgi:hypothetical protein
MPIDEMNPNVQVMIQNAEDQQKPNLGPDFRPDNGPYQKLVDHCEDLYDAFSKSAYRDAKIREIIESRKVYEQQERQRVKPLWDGESSMTLPLTTITCDNLEPRLVSGLIGRDPLIRFEMEGMTEQDEPTKLIQGWFNQELDNEVKIKANTGNGVHILLLEGTWYCFPGYNRHELPRRDFVFNEDGSMVINPETQEPETADIIDVLFEGGEIKHIPFTDVLCPDNIGSVAEWELCDKGVIIRPTYAELMRDKEKLGYLPDKVGPWLVPQKGNLKKKDDDKSPDEQVTGAEVTGKEVIKCVNWYISYPINRVEDAPEQEQDDFTEERIIATVTLDTGVLIRVGLLRDFNFSNECMLKRVRLYPESDRSYGTSMYGKMKSIQNGASDFFNTVINISTLCMIPWFFYDDASGMKKETELFPGKGVPVDSVAGIKIPDFFKLNPGNYLQFIEVFMRLWEQVGNISNPQIGRPDDKQKTATEIMAVIQEGNIKYDYQANTTKDEFIGIIKTLYDLYYQHMPFNKTFIYNGEPVPIPRKLMRQRFKFTLSGSTASANKMIERKEAEDILMLSQGNPLMNPMKALEDVLKAYGKTDLAQYVNPEAKQVLQALFENPELPKIIAQYLMTKQTTMAAVGIEPEKGAKAA